MHVICNAGNRQPVNSEERDEGNTRSERGEVVSTVIRQGGRMEQVWRICRRKRVRGCFGSAIFA